jgi:hypothetical protein
MVASMEVLGGLSLMPLVHLELVDGGKRVERRKKRTVTRPRHKLSLRDGRRIASTVIGDLKS